MNRQLNDIYLDLKRLSEYSSLSVRTLRDHISDCSNPLPHFRVKGKILVRQSEFDKWTEGFRGKSSVDGIVEEVLRNM